MIIQCVKCNKNFEVNSSLIPDSGRILQCGSCNHKWFYDPNNFTNYQDSTRTNLTEKISIINENEDLVKIKKKKISIQNDKFKSDKKDIKDNINTISKNKDTSLDLNLGKILSFITVAIISFVALVIILDTFKFPLSRIFPNIELILYNLFETVKDISLFIKNLLL